ncbi:hypothetical protein KYB31_14560 [Clostridium felsineum]|nr:hypothetical protein [Clostridium felsineum]
MKKRRRFYVKKKFSFLFSKVKKEIQKSIGYLSNNEILEVVDYIEMVIFSGNYIEEEAFDILKEGIKNRFEDSRSFFEYKSLNEVLEKLNWLEFKNLISKYDYLEEEIVKGILKVNPELKTNLIKLIDLENEREEKVIRHIRANR